ncbi:MAG: hypothetical protein EBR02_10415, partial [Alphaproteobacteria bacterium]|nr:hypothetical protein [Alphaproteobacteria bacterium]
MRDEALIISKCGKEFGSKFAELMDLLSNASDAGNCRVKQKELDEVFAWMDTTISDTLCDVTNAAHDLFLAEMRLAYWGLRAGLKQRDQWEQVVNDA